MTQLNEVLAMSLEDRLVLVATKKHLGEQIYLALARDENAAVRRIVASSDMVAYPVTVADLLAFDENEKVRVAIAHRRMSEHAVAHLANDPSRAVRCAVLACPTLSMDDAERIVFELADVLEPDEMPIWSLSELVGREDLSDRLREACAYLAGGALASRALIRASLETARVLASAPDWSFASELAIKHGQDPEVVDTLTRLWLSRLEVDRPGATTVLRTLLERCDVPDDLFLLMPGYVATGCMKIWVRNRLCALYPPEWDRVMMGLLRNSQETLGSFRNVIADLGADAAALAVALAEDAPAGTDILEAAGLLLAS